MLGISRAAVAQWETGQTTPAAERLITLAEKLGVSFEWLYWGREPMDDPGSTPAGYAWIRGIAAVTADVQGDPAIRYGSPQLFPTTLINDDLRGDAADFIVLDMADDAMAPLIPEGSTLLIDRRAVYPTPAGAFALWDGTAVIVQWVRRLPGRGQPKLRLSSENRRLDPYETDLDSVRLLGRVVWFSRRL